MLYLESQSQSECGSVRQQACRGDKHDDPVPACDAVDSETNEVVVDASAIHTLPAGADFIMCYSVAEGEPAGKFKTLYLLVSRHDVKIHTSFVSADTLKM